MVLNYVLLAITAILSIAGIIGMLRGSAYKVNVFYTVAAVAVFAIALIATLKGIDYAAFKIMIESALKGE